MIYVLGGGGKLFAAIGVTYPAGSICSCTKDGVTRRAGDTSGQWVFPVSGTGTYTISCTSGSNTATKTVSITAKGQSEKLTLSFRPDGYIYWDGLKASGISLDIQQGSYATCVDTGTELAFTYQSGQTAADRIRNSVNFLGVNATPYNTLKFTVIGSVFVHTGDTNRSWAGMVEAVRTPGNLVSYYNPVVYIAEGSNISQTFSVDISATTRNIFTITAALNGKISRVWME